MLKIFSFPPKIFFLAPKNYNRLLNSIVGHCTTKSKFQLVFLKMEKDGHSLEQLEGDNNEESEIYQISKGQCRFPDLSMSENVEVRRMRKILGKGFQFIRSLSLELNVKPN